MIGVEDSTALRCFLTCCRVSLTKDRFLGITNEDIFTLGLNFLFGEADPSGGRAIISLKRLHESFYGRPENEKLFQERMLKEAVHELGHTYGFSHCRDPKCVMHFSSNIDDVDRKNVFFCPSCAARVVAGRRR